jgi:hypothetical protein
MSEEEKPDPILRDVEVLKRDAVVKIDMPVAVHTRLNQFILEEFAGTNKEEFAKLLDKIVKNDIEQDRRAYHLSTLITIATLIENSAREQGFTEKVDYNMETGEYITPSKGENQSSPQ